MKRKGTLGSPYSVRDYYSINPTMARRKTLKRARAPRSAHRLHLRVILDIVANHTVMMQTPEFYKHNAAGQGVLPPVADWEEDVATSLLQSAPARGVIDMLRSTGSAI